MVQQTLPSLLEPDEGTPSGDSIVLPGVAIVVASLIESGEGDSAWFGPGQKPRVTGRVLCPLAGRPVLHRVIVRIAKARHLSRIVVATSVAPEDDAVARCARQAGAEVYRGSLHDLVGRLVGLVDWLELADEVPVVRLLGEAPLVDPDYLDAGLETMVAYGAKALEFLEDQAEEICAGLSAGFLRAGTLRLLDRRARTKNHRMDAMRYIYEEAEEMGLCRVPLPITLVHLLGTHRLILQTQADLLVLQTIWARLSKSAGPAGPENPDGPPISTKEALDLLDMDPELSMKNRGGQPGGRAQSGALLFHGQRPKSGWRPT